MTKNFMNEARLLNSLATKVMSSRYEFCRELVRVQKLVEQHKIPFYVWADQHLICPRTNKPWSFRTLYTYVAEGRKSYEEWCGYLNKKDVDRAERRRKMQARLGSNARLPEGFSKAYFQERTRRDQAAMMYQLWLLTDPEARVLFMSFVREDEQVKKAA